MFVRLADRLTTAGFDVVRFTYRGHGDSDGESAGVTIGGELLDFEAAFEHTVTEFDGPYFVVAKSFGAVSTCLSLDRYAEDIAGVALWNPVLDIEGTFLDPSVEWGRHHFTGERLETLYADGALPLDEEFSMGRVLYEELHRYAPGERFVESTVPALVVHGTADEIVPYDDTRRVARRKGAAFHTIEDADHGFVRPGERPADEDREQDRRTVEWLTARTSD
ncbi:alpha/beta hydrolase [Halomicroarcula sp. GCM10025709]